MKVHLKDSKQLGNDIRLFRMRKHWSQSELAKHLNVSAQAISNWERGETYMSLDIIVQLSALMGVSLDDLLLYDVHGAYSYASIFDRIRLREFWLDLIDIQKNPDNGEIIIDIRLQYDRYTFFVDDIFSVQLRNDKEQDIPFQVHGWMDEERGSDAPMAQEVSRVYRISYRQVYQPAVLVLKYNSFIKHIGLKEDYINCIIKAQTNAALSEEDASLNQKIIEFFMKANKIERLMKFMHHKELSESA
jgi:transcriptional regulator with XRE-family HTH domain